MTVFIMPELPEVETVRTALEGAIAGAVIHKIQLRRKDLRIPFPKDLNKRLADKRIERIARRAKYLLFYCSGGEVMLAHLGMSGRFSVLEKPLSRYDTHDHMIIHLDDDRVVVYNDTRRFGLVSLCLAKDVGKHKLLAKLGPEPLEKQFNAPYLEAQLKRRSGSVKAALMDQELVVGVGNIYASEALFMTGTLPDISAKKAACKAPELVKAIQKVLKAAIKSGGSSLRDFYQISGETGCFQHQFQVYGRQNEPCYRCNTPIKLIRLSGRSSFFCPTCQS